MYTRREPCYKGGEASERPYNAIDDRCEYRLDPSPRGLEDSIVAPRTTSAFFLNTVLNFLKR